MDEFRTEYVEALDAARWNFWWYIAAAIPFVLLIPAVYKRKLGCLALPLSYLGSWIAICMAVYHYWDAKKANAVNDAEWEDVGADTARVFASATVLPYVVAYVTIVAVILYASFAAFRYFRGKNS